MDDDWAIVQGRESCRIKAKAVSADLYNAGFVINKEKSVWEPTQLLHWLGITWNSAQGTLEIVERRIVKITNTIDHIIVADMKVSARVLASFTDQIISTGPVVGNFGRIMTRHCALSTLCKDNWVLYSVLTITARKNCIFGRTIWLISTLGILFCK